ncbi:MAG: RdgB/HAM1 family non-canonical purine NTP pyrophosphatase [Actinomycetota bacterium]|nr:RdgB/HAM1 family non-canonical purine NTP pyrophosphatase [Actinomycetota bacterium]
MSAAAPADRLVLATRNPHKVAELRDILADVRDRTGMPLVGVSEFPGLEDVVESGVTFVDNALSKARAVALATGLPALADDSGLAVDVLGGSPGVFSARWSGVGGPDRDRANNELLLAQLGDVPDQHRGAGFVCAAVLALPDGSEVVREGVVRGTLGRAPRGDGGFGYDPLLVLPDGRTLAEHSPAEKHRISHRGVAFRALAEDLVRILGAATGRHTKGES